MLENLIAPNYARKQAALILNDLDSFLTQFGGTGYVQNALTVVVSEI